MQTKVARPPAAKMIDTAKFGAAIRAKRGGKTLREIGEELGMGWSRLAAYEREEAQPGLAHFIRVCRWLDVPMEYFITTKQDTQT